MSDPITLRVPTGGTHKPGQPIYFGSLGGPDPRALPLPALRDDLQLLPGPQDRGGRPTWTIYDPVRHRFHRLSLTACEMLQRWNSETFGALCDRMEAETTSHITVKECADLVHFLRSHGLVDLSSAQDLRGWMAQVRASRPPLLTWLLHNYLFIRIPLVRPDQFLARTWPWVRPLYSQTTLWVLLGLLCLGLYLVGRQWDAFVGSFATYSSWDGLIWTGVTLICAKIIHELGHAYTAYRYRCRVASMGLAFMVLMPVLYTDTSDSWRLPSRRQRLAIGSAGIAAELALAICATLLWSFLPDGAARAAVFIIATASWVTTLTINLSPFMRFDGYYLLSDLWKIPNLQNRAFAHTRWQIREWIFGLGDAPPEPWPPLTARWLILYSLGTWIYRLFLFIGIALLVYHVTFKVLGIILFVVEIMWFVVKPIMAELKVWWARRGEISARPRTLACVGLALALLAGLVLPWQKSIPLPATLEAAEAPSLYAPQAALVSEIHVQNGDSVVAGQPLIQLSNPELDARIATAENRLLQARLKVIQAATLRERAEDRLALELERDRAQQSLDGLRQRRDRLTITAPLSGRVVDMPSELSTGIWIPEKVELGRVLTPERPARVIAYADEQQSQRFAAGDPVQFYDATTPLTAISGQVEAIESVNIKALPAAYLAANQGGPIAVLNESGSTLMPIPEVPLYRVLITLDQPPPAPMRVRIGTAQIDGQAQSPLSRAWRAAAAVLVRESGF